MKTRGIRNFGIARPLITTSNNESLTRYFDNGRCPADHAFHKCKRPFSVRTKTEHSGSGREQYLFSRSVEGRPMSAMTAEWPANTS